MSPAVVSNELQELRAQRDAAVAEAQRWRVRHEATSSELSATASKLGATASKLHLATAENVTLRERAEHLQARLDHLTRMMFGRRSERLVDPAQNHLFTDGEEEAQADEPVETETLTYERKKPRGGGRKPIDPRLRRVEVRHELPAEELTDPVTGELLYEPFDVRVTEKLGCTPMELFVESHEHVKYRRIKVDGKTPERLVESDPPEIREAPPTREGLPRCLASPSLLAELLYAKFGMHVPFSRLLKDIKRQSGVEISSTSVSRWTQEIAELCGPLVNLMKCLLFEHSLVIQNDDTTVKLQPGKHSGKGKCHTANFWSTIGQADTLGHYVLFNFTRNRTAESPKAWFSDDAGVPIFDGFLQGDRYAGYDLLTKPCEEGVPWSMTFVGCWAHARRKFFDARGGAPGDSARALSMIRGFYDIEAELQEERTARKKAGDFDLQAWLALRRQRRIDEVLPLVDAFFAWTKERCDTLARPQHIFVKAARYALNQEAALREFLSEGILEIDNNACERSIRPLAIGRKNWTFVGSEAAGDAAATIFSLVASAELHGRNPRSYLEDLIRRLRSTPKEELASLLPDRWESPATSLAAAAS